MTILQAVFLLVGIAFALFLLCLAVLWWEKNWRSDRYDERQQISRNKSYRLAFWLGFLYYGSAAVYLISQVEGEKKIEPYLLLFFGIMFQALVTHIYGLLTGSALPFSQKPGWMVLCYLFMGFTRVMSLRMWHNRGLTISLTGQGTILWVDLLIAVISFVLAALYLISALRKEKEE